MKVEAKDSCNYRQQELVHVVFHYVHPSHWLTSGEVNTTCSDLCEGSQINQSPQQFIDRIMKLLYTRKKKKQPERRGEPAGRGRGRPRRAEETDNESDYGESLNIT